MVCKDVLKFFCNLLQGEDRTSVKKLDEDLHILWASKGCNIDLSKWSKDDFSTGLISDYINCKYFASKPMTTKNFGLCFATKEKFYRHFLATTVFHLVTAKKFRLPVGACRKKLISDPVLQSCMDKLSSQLQQNTDTKSFSKFLDFTCPAEATSFVISHQATR